MYKKSRVSVNKRFTDNRVVLQKKMVKLEHGYFAKYYYLDLPGVRIKH